MDNTFDVVVCNHVITNLQDPRAALKEIGRVTKPGGKVVILMLHPCFYTGNLELGEVGEIPIDAYFGARQIDQKFNVAGIKSPEEIHIKLYPLEYYISLLIKSGYVITQLSEPHPSPDQLRQEWWHTHFQKPLFMLLVESSDRSNHLKDLRISDLDSNLGSNHCSWRAAETRPERRRSARPPQVGSPHRASLNCQYVKDRSMIAPSSRSSRLELVRTSLKLGSSWKN